MKIRELHAAKTRFLAHTSHDLLQPINAARLFIASLQNKAAAGSWREMGDDIHYIDSALTSAEQLIGALREISRLDAGNLKPKREHFPLRQLLDGLNAEFSALASERGLALHYVPSNAWVVSDRHLLRRILQNFLSNALHYTARGRVLLGMRRRIGSDGNPELEIQVWDTGPGIDRSARERIFDEFVRLGSSERNADKGLGLGLAIARRSADLLGHPLGLESTPGRGSMFSIRVPVGEARAAPVEEPTVSEVGNVSAVPVLCIDNERQILRGMQSLLSGWGCRVVTAISLPEALVRWDLRDPPALVIVDYHLDRDATGIDALEALCEHWRAELPGIVVSADTSEEIRSAATERGWFYLPKPVKPAVLRNLVRRLARTAGNNVS
ncbi:hybrid sensor histidine kinase/response regulator [Microbulbifer harenosus]